MYSAASLLSVAVSSEPRTSRWRRERQAQVAGKGFPSASQDRLMTFAWRTSGMSIMASTCAPILIQMGIPKIAAHFFVFYFGIVADITPPVALAAYAGAAIAKAKPMQTGVTATRLAIGAFIIPFVFAYSPSLLLIDTVWYEVILLSITAAIGIFGVASGLSGYLYRDMNLIERIITMAGGLMLIIPGIATDLGGIALVGAVFAWQYFFSRRKAAA